MVIHGMSDVIAAAERIARALERIADVLERSTDGESGVSLNVHTTGAIETYPPEPTPTRHVRGGGG